MVGSYRPNRPSGRKWSEITLYAGLSLGSFLGFLVLAGLSLWKADRLAALGLASNFYYLILVVLSLAASGFLFGALRSYASYSGRHFGGRLELGGAVVVFLLIIVLGFKLLPESLDFPITVYVHGSAGPQDLILKSSGRVLLDLGGNRRAEPIGEKGQAFFPEIPPSFRGQQVNVLLDAPEYEMANPGQQITIDGASVYLEVREKPGHVAGRVQDEAGNPLSGVNIRVADLTATTDLYGHFDVVVANKQPHEALSPQAVAPDFVHWENEVIPNANEQVITLK